MPISFRITAQLEPRISQARTAIIDLFSAQVAQGQQTQELPNDTAACGQFIGTSARMLRQRGLHGIAAAIRVLRESPNDRDRQLVQRLVRYIANRLEIERGIPSHNELQELQRKVETDRSNVLKMAELLWGLASIQPPQPEITNLVGLVEPRIQEGYTFDQGWDFFVGEGKPSAVATAYVLLGLTRGGFNVHNAAAYLEREVAATAKSGTVADATLGILYLYALTFGARPSADVPSPHNYKQYFTSFWRTLEPQMWDDLEQNFAYERGLRNYYVRIPWQLYALSLAAHYSLWAFASVPAQRRLDSMLKGLNDPANPGFGYPHSERALSSRTHAIIFEVLGIIQSELRRLRIVGLLHAFDVFRRAMASRPLRMALALSASVACGLAIVQWWRSPTSSLADVAPDLLGALLGAVILLGKRS